jgi:hypothetical protein
MYLARTVLESGRGAGAFANGEYLLVGANDRVATKVVPPTLHVGVQIWLAQWLSQVDSPYSTEVAED